MRLSPEKQVIVGLIIAVLFWLGTLWYIATSL
jgi:hypothetical protein